MKTFCRDLCAIVVSLKLTILLLVFGMVLVFAATLDQVNLGIWAVQEKYFRSFVVYMQAGQATIPAFPGGYTVGGLLLINLVAAHVFRFRFEWKKAGIVLTHLGLIVLLVGELLTGLWQEDAHLRLTEGETKNYAESSREYEFAVIDTRDAAHDLVASIPEAMLARKTSVQMPQLPFRVVTLVSHHINLDAVAGVEDDELMHRRGLPKPRGQGRLAFAAEGDLFAEPEGSAAMRRADEKESGVVHVRSGWSDLIMPGGARGRAASLCQSCANLAADLNQCPQQVGRTSASG
jgi:hypothetical protein